MTPNEETNTFEETTISQVRRIRKRTSEVWRDFDKSINIQGEPTIVCKKCKAILIAKSSSGIGHLKHHIEQHKTHDAKIQAQLNLVGDSLSSWQYSQEI